MNYKEWFYYDPSSPSGLRWKKDVKFGTIKAGSQAGTMTNPGYWQLKFKGNFYMAHRVIWELHHGSIPDSLHLDHIDRDKANNKIENLRIASNSQNGANKVLQSNNVTGAKGVYWNSKNKKWISNIVDKRKTLYLGSFDDFIEAAKEYDAAAIRIHGEFAVLNSHLGVY